LHGHRWRRGAAVRPDRSSSARRVIKITNRRCT
jgi:hypothetical protein